ncbi:polyhydroxyalkanoic acid system family protein [Sphingomonas hylomeconis]|uniref:Polyhydroxyalkanoic acid system family protein n=1 Tax=Sphingomonas hylomeconis TaxID=1395958 RepID=A0ABV7SWL8_9SPHN|nr:polyhydroxyalkanoic acid system family protein [Sphingomonas hylomeconis]
MTEPITMDIPHKYGREGVRAKLDAGVDKIAGVVPGGVVKDHRWDGDTLHFTIEGMGQRVASQVELFDDKVRATIDLPPFLALFAAKIRDKLAKEAPKLLK